MQNLISKRISFNVQPLHNPKLPYQANADSFEFISKCLATLRAAKPSLIALHAAPGLGKSALLDNFASNVANWRRVGKRPELLKSAPEWLRDAIIISVSFNFNSQPSKMYYFLVISKTLCHYLIT